MNTKETKGAVKFLAIVMAVLIFASAMIWGFQSNWGKTKIKRLTLTGDDGSAISTLVYVPENATNETPAPAVMIFHGRSNQGHSNDTWCMELSRRGFVVFSPDLSGGGESDVTDRARQAMAVTRYASIQPYISEINLAGYSFGTQTCLDVYGEMPEIINSITEVFGPYRLVNAEKADPENLNRINTNLCVLKASADQYDHYFIGDADACAVEMTRIAQLDEPIVPDKDYDWRGQDGHLFRYMICENTLHQTGNISGSTLTNLISFITTVSKAPIELDIDNQVWVPHQLFSGVACLAMVFMLAAILNLLMQIPFFASAANPVPVKAPRTGAKPWIMDIIFSTIIPAVIFIPVSLLGMRWTAPDKGISNVFKSTNLNGIMLWLLAISAIAVVRMILAANKMKANKQAITLDMYAMGAEGETKINWGRVLRGIILGICTVSIVGIWLWLVEGFLGINYQVWTLSTYLRFSPMRIVACIPYMIPIFIAMFIGGMSQRVLPSSGNERKDMIKTVAISTIMTASALFVLLLIQYGGNMIMNTGETILPQFDVYKNGGVPSAGALDFAFGYCYMMGGMTGVVSYLYRKYGNIFVGVIPCTMFAALVTVGGFTLVH